MHKLKLTAAVAAVMVATPVLAAEVTVWDVNVPRNPTYYEAAKVAFEKAHPGDTINFVGQPDAEYYNPAEHRPCIQDRPRRDVG